MYENSIESFVVVSLWVLGGDPNAVRCLALPNEHEAPTSAVSLRKTCPRGESKGGRRLGGTQNTYILLRSRSAPSSELRRSSSTLCTLLCHRSIAPTHPLPASPPLPSHPSTTLTASCMSAQVQDSPSAGAGGAGAGPTPGTDVAALERKYGPVDTHTTGPARVHRKMMETVMTGANTAFAVVDLGHVQRQYNRWVKLLPRIRPFYAGAARFCNMHTRWVALALTRTCGAVFVCSQVQPGPTHHLDAACRRRGLRLCVTFRD